MSLLLAFVFFVLLVIVFSALTITTSGIRAALSLGAEEDAAGEEAEALKFVLLTALGKSMHRGAGAGKQLKQARQRWAESKGGAPALHTQVTGALLKNLGVFCEGAPEGSRALTFQAKGSASDSFPYAWIQYLV